ncbi:MAG: YIP1 family protein [Acidobacteriaceae bacterium]|nr:YIP1 family protein [Acidobacteriaceae bacterium]
MSTAVPDSPLEKRETLGDDIAGMGCFFVDPRGAAQRAFNKWFWVVPLIAVSIIAVVAGIIRLPIAQHAMETMPLPPNANPEQFQRGMEIGMKIQNIAIWCTPVIIVIFYLIYAVILFGMASILGVTAKFRWLLNVVAGCSLIQALASIASTLILKAKGEVSTMAELQPPLGLDIFLPEGTNKFLLALAGYFSIFEIWWLIMIVLVMSHAFRIGKGKAFGMVLPLVLLNIVFRLVGAIFTRT